MAYEGDTVTAKNPSFNAMAKNVDGVDMVHIKIGKEELWFTIEEAYGFAEHINDVAGDRRI